MSLGVHVPQDRTTIAPAGGWVLEALVPRHQVGAGAVIPVDDARATSYCCDMHNAINARQDDEETVSFAKVMS